MLSRVGPGIDPGAVGSAEMLIAAEQKGPLGSTQKGMVNRASGHGGGHRQVTAGEPLGETEEIWHHVFYLTGEHSAGAAEAGHHLIENQMDSRGIAPGTQFRKHSGGPRSHFVDALNEWLDDNGRDPISR